MTQASQGAGNEAERRILVHIHPLVLGGDPASEQNVARVTIEKHFELMRYWNKIIAELRKQDGLIGVDQE